VAKDIYKQEEAWRAFMLISHERTRAAIKSVSLSIYAAAALIILAGYSRPLALGLAILAVIATAVSMELGRRSRNRMIDSVTADPTLDL
jgi:hypothetical protein